MPVKRLKGKHSADITKSVINELQAAGLKILTIVSDNHGVNRVMFKELANSESGHYFQIEGNPFKTFMLYDSVHILKNIRNNWINLKDSLKTFHILPYSCMGKY